MSLDIDDGPAFPRDHTNDGHNGMTLRDYFAAKFAAAFCSTPEGCISATPGIDATWQAATARNAYELADAMLEARKAKPWPATS